MNHKLFAIVVCLLVGITTASLALCLYSYMDYKRVTHTESPSP